MIAYGMLNSISLLTNAAEIFRSRCIDHVEADELRCRQNLEASTAKFTALVPTLGYEEASRLAKEMLAGGTSWAELSKALRALSPRT